MGLGMRRDSVTEVTVFSRNSPNIRIFPRKCVISVTCVIWQRWNPSILPPCSVVLVLSLKFVGLLASRALGAGDPRSDQDRSGCIVLKHLLTFFGSLNAG